MKSKELKWLIPVGAASLVVALFPKQVALAVQLALGGAAIAFLLRPLALRLEKFMKPATAAIMSVAGTLLLLALVMVLALPPLIGQLADLAQQVGKWIEWGKQALAQLMEKAKGMGFKVPEDGALDFSAIAGNASGIISGTALIAGSVADFVTKATLSVMLGVYFLLDWEGFTQQLELMIPSRARRIVLRMAGESGRGLRGYLRGQLTVSVIVGVIASAGLALIGVKSFLVLGVIVGLTNMVPYFGPIIGGVPAVLAALSQDLIRALMCVAVLFIVQQVDGMLISPRVMSGVTGLPPAVVLISLTVGGSGWGIMGMLLALPVVLIVRICFRVWATRNEVIEKPPNV